MQETHITIIITVVQKYARDSYNYYHYSITEICETHIIITITILQKYAKDSYNYYTNSIAQKCRRHILLLSLQKYRSVFT